MCFSRKTNKDKILLNDSVMKENLKSFDILIAYAEGNAETVKKLEEVKDKYKYLSPKADSDVTAVDKKIGNKIADIKVLLSKGGKPRDEEINAELQAITRMMAER